MRGVFAAAIRERDARGVYAIVTYERVAAAYPPLIRPCGATFSLRAKSRLRRLRYDTRLRAQPLGGGL